MIRKTPKEIKKPKAENKIPNSWSYLSGNESITYSDDCVIKSWRWPLRRQCRPGASSHPTLVEIDGHCDWSWRFNLLSKREVTTFASNKAIGYDMSMVVTGDCAPAFAFLVWGRNRSKEFKNCDIKEPYDPTQNMRFLQLVELDGIFYSISLQGSVVEIGEEVVGSDRFGITRIGGNRAVPSKACKQFREFLVKSDGDIMVVFLISRKSIKVVDDVEVFRLDTRDFLWVRVENIGDRAFFLDGKGCSTFSRMRGRVDKNCIYFTHSWIHGYMVFDMETRLILPHFDIKIETK